MAEAVVDVVNDIAPNYMITVRVVGVNKWRVRLWVAGIFIRIAAKIANVGIKFEDKPFYSADL